MNPIRRRDFLAAPFVYREALPGYRYEFPRDHFEHPEFRTEWWYYTGNLSTADRKEFGFELTFFRHGLDPRVEPQSPWDVADVYLAHLALSDIGGQAFLHRERLNRAGAGIAGASFAQRRIWNGNWQVAWDGDRQKLSAIADRFSIHLELDSVKPPVIHGRNGVSQKAAGEGRASHYVSLSRLATRGEIVLDDAKHAVTGTAWMDHEFFTNQLSEDQAGWDWFSIQLDNNCELMLFQLRRKDGSIEPLSHGTFVDIAGKAQEISRSQFRLTPGPRRFRKYPIEWRIEVPSLGIDLRATTPLAGQELLSTNRLSPSYWEGVMRFEGSTARGVGYLEMTGYDQPIRFR